MPTTPPTPATTVKALLVDGWDATATDLGTTPPISTGWFSRDGPRPAIAVTGANDGPADGGVTGYNAMTGDGRGAVQLREGNVTVDVLAGSYNDVPDGSDVQAVREQMFREVVRVIMANQTAGEFWSMSIGDARDIQENTHTGENGPPVVFRKQIRVEYTYEIRPA